MKLGCLDRLVMVPDEALAGRPGARTFALVVRR